MSDDELREMHDHLCDDANKDYEAKYGEGAVCPVGKTTYWNLRNGKFDIEHKQELHDMTDSQFSKLDENHLMLIKDMSSVKEALEKLEERVQDLKESSSTAITWRYLAYIMILLICGGWAVFTWHGSTVHNGAAKQSGLDEMRIHFDERLDKIYQLFLDNKK